MATAREIELEKNCLEANVAGHWPTSRVSATAVRRTEALVLTRNSMSARENATALESVGATAVHALPKSDKHGIAQIIRTEPHVVKHMRPRPFDTHEWGRSGMGDARAVASQMPQFRWTRECEDRAI